MRYDLDALLPEASPESSAEQAQPVRAGATQYDDVFAAAERDYGIPAELLKRQMLAESGGRADAIGPATKYGQAVGLMQFPPSTAKEIGIDPTDPVQSIFGAAYKLRTDADKRFNGDLALAVAAYHGGYDTKGWGPKTMGYVEKIFGQDDFGIVGKKPEPAAEEPIAAPVAEEEKPGLLGGLNNLRKSMQQETTDNLDQVGLEQNFGEGRANAAAFAVTERNDARKKINASLAAAGPVDEREILRQEIGSGRSFGEMVADTATATAAGVKQLAAAPVGLVAPGSGLAASMKKSARQTNATLSPQMQAQLKQFSLGIKNAADEGRWEEVKAAFGGLSPALVAHFTANTLPSMLPVLGAGKVAQIAAAARGASTTGVALAGVRGAGAANAVLNAGSARQDSYDDLKATFTEQGMTPDKAHHAALIQSVLPAAVGGATGYIGGRFGAESDILGGTLDMAAKGGVLPALKAAIGSIGRELTTEQAEELLPKMTTNLLAGRDAFDGAAEIAAQTVAGVAGPGSLGAMSAGRRAYDPLGLGQLDRDINAATFTPNSINAAAVESLRTSNQIAPELTRKPTATQVAASGGSMADVANAEITPVVVPPPVAPVAPAPTQQSTAGTLVEAGQVDQNDIFNQIIGATNAAEPVQVVETPPQANGPQAGTEANPDPVVQEAVKQELATRQPIEFNQATVEDSRGKKVDGFRAEFGNNNGGNGYIELAVDGSRIYPTMVDNGLFRLNETTGGAVSKAYEQAIDFAERTGKAFTSDDSVTIGASRIYESLERKGYTVKKNPAARLATSPEVLTDRLVTDDGSPVYTVSKRTTKQPAQQQQAKARNIIDTAKDSALVAIAKLGGMDTQQLLANGFDQNDISVQKGARVSKKTGQLGKAPFRARSVGFNLPIHRNGGMSLDGMREALVQRGYLPEGASVNDAMELLHRELRGEPVYTAEAVESQVAEAEAARQAEMEAEAIANEQLGLDDETRPFNSAVDLVVDAVENDRRSFIEEAIFSGLTEEQANAIYEESIRTAQGANDAAGVGAQASNRDGREESQADERDFGGKESAEPDWLSDDGFGLTGQTEAEVRAQEAERRAEEERTKREAAEAELAKKDAELQAEVKQRSAAAAETFELGQDAMDNLNGQGGLRFSKASPADEFTPDAALIDAAKKHFMVTQDINEAGYIMPDGSMLDFSGKHYSSRSNWPYIRGQRNVDHRELTSENTHTNSSLESFFEKTDGSDIMEEFMVKTGAMRVDFNAGVSSIARPPTEAQLRLLGRMKGWSATSYIDPSNGRIVADIEWENTTPAKIRNFFAENVGKSADKNSAKFSFAGQSSATAERRATPPSQTADVAESDVIVVFNGKEMASAPVPANVGGVSPKSTITESSARELIASSLRETPAKVLLDSGLITFVSRGADFQGATFQDGRIILNLDALTEENFAGVLEHEGFHSTVKTLIGEAKYNQLMRQLELNLKAAKGNEAIARAEKAIPADTKPEHRTEELGAYWLEQWRNGAKVPNFIKRWAESFMSALRTAIIRFANADGKLQAWAMNNLKPEDLSNLAIAGLRAKARGAMQGQMREGLAYSKTPMPDTIDVDGVERPTRNSNGQPIHLTEDGIRNFWRWYDGLQQQRLDRAGTESGRGAGAQGTDQRTAGREGYFFDAEGRPKVFYHGTNADIPAFDLDHKDKWDNGWLGRGVYLASDTELSNFYANQKGGQSNVMPLYAGVTNPYVFTLKEKQKLRNATAEEIKAITSRLQDNGYDGGVLEFGDGSLEVVAFNRNAVKSALGNRGTFDGTNPDILYSRASGNQQNGFALPKFTATDKWQERIQDRYNRFRDVLKYVRDQGGVVNDLNDFSMGEDRFHGVAMERVIGVQEKLQAILSEAKANDVTMDEVMMFGYAEHAPDRNRAMQAINPNVQTGSGMSDQDAADIIAAADAEGNRATLEALTEKVRDIARDTLELQVRSGLTTRAEADAYRAKYGDKWLPLRGFETINENGRTFRGTGRGFNIQGKENLQALGRDSKAGQILENVLMDAERTAIRATKNEEVNLRFLKFVIDNPDQNLWEVDKVKTIRVMRDGMVKEDMIIDKGDGTIGVKVNGEVVYIKVHDDKLFEQLANQWNDVEWNGIPYLQDFSRYLSRSYTAWSPEFALYTNPVRDVQAALFSITGREGIGMTGGFVKAYPKAVKMAYNSEVRGKDDPLYAEYKKMGGKTGFWNHNTLETKVKEIEALVKDMEATPTGNPFRYSWKMMKALEAVISNHAGALENATRFASYIAMREAGRSREESAAFAKNLNVNFNRRGTWTAGIGSIVLFFNPAIQGVHNQYETLLKGKHKYQAWALMAAHAAAMGGLAMLAASSGEDDDGVKWWDKIPDYEKERNIIIMLPSYMKDYGHGIEDSTGRYLKIPMPYQWNVGGYLGTLAADVYRNKESPTEGTSAPKAALLLGKSVVTSYVPGGIPPTIAPIVHHAFNDAPFGDGQLYPENSWNKHKPDSEKYTARQKDTPWQHWASFVNEATGGNEFESGYVSIAPAAWKNYVRSYVGGPASFVEGIYDAAIEEDITKAPFLRKMYGEVDMRRDAGKFYDTTEKPISKLKAYKDADKAGSEYANEIAKTHGVLLDLGEMALDYQKYLGKITKDDIAIKDDKSLSVEMKKMKLRKNEKERSDIQEQYLKEQRRIISDAALKK